MRHLEIRDLWLQQEVLNKKVVVSKVAGEENPADLMTKILGMADITSRLAHMNIRIINDGGKTVGGEVLGGMGGLRTPDHI